MSFSEYLEELKKIQENILDYIDDEATSEEKFQNIKNFFNQIHIHDNIYKIKQILYLLSKISENHHYKADFYTKIEHILQLFAEDMKKNLSNINIFNIFKGNKRILLFLFDEKIIAFDESIAKLIVGDEYINSKYPEYFSPEIKPYIDLKWFPDKGFTKLDISIDYYANDESFYEKRKIGQNDDFVCKLVQNDLIDDFIIYVNKNSYSLNSTFESTIYETNNLLLKMKKTTLIEYTVFYGSIQIFNYLKLNGVKLTPSLWNYAIHGKNPEIIHILEENHIQPPKSIDDDDKNSPYEHLFIESIKCHHNDIANYIQNNYLQITEEKSNEALMSIFKNNNFQFIQNDESVLYYSCKYNYYYIVTLLFKRTDIDINKANTIYTTFLNDISKIISFDEV